MYNSESFIIVILLFLFRTPFTIQRICELVTNPTKHYKKADKFMRGIEKVGTVVQYISLSCDQLWAASLIGRNAVTW